MRLLALFFALILAACVAAAPQIGGKPVTGVQNPITGGPIAVTTLDAPVPAQNGAAPYAKPVATPPLPRAAEPPAVSAAAKPRAAAALSDLPTTPRVVSPEEKTCVKQGGSWAQAGKTGGKTCIRLTKDGGKRCQAEKDCEGYCLARSATCAPAIPMFGCNDILQDNGVQVTLCID